MNSKESVFLISLGCAKNLVDSEHMLGQLESRGYRIVSRMEEAQVALINTCGFIESAVEETIDTILEVVNLKEQGKLKRIVVAGCFVQRYGYKLKREIPEVDAWLGVGEFYRVTDVIGTDTMRNTGSFFINRPTYLADHRVPRVQTTPFYTAFLRIAEGCSHRCSYCTIPRLRGSFRSRSRESLIEEAQRMVGRGVKEINLVAQDTTMYGGDLREGICLEDLLESLIEIKGLKWLRLLYSHPSRISDRLLELMESEEIICPYLDVPLQHVNVKILAAMRRESRGESPLELVWRVKAKTRRISLRTTVMVGFPGETEKEFHELCEFVKRVRFDYLGAFAFSEEQGTPAARLEPKVGPKTAGKRLHRLLALQRDISRKNNQRFLGQVVPVLIEGRSPETDLLLKGRTATMAPDVDAQVLINRGEGIVGEVMDVRITEAHVYDLVGEIAA